MTTEPRMQIRLYFFVLLTTLGAWISSGCDAGTEQESASQHLATKEMLDTRIAQRAAEDGFTGSVLVASNDELILHKTYGPLSTLKTGPAYWIASNSKQFTGALISVLAKEGKIDFDARIGQYLTGVPVDKQNITIRQLLTHTSGLDHQYAAEGITNREEAIVAILNVALMAPPGERYAYSNDGFSLLAILAEIVAGESFEELMRSRIFEPSGLEQTGLWGFETGEFIAPPLSNDAVEAQLDTIYVDGHSQSNWGYRGSTGVYSTTHDLHRWAARVLNARSDNDDPLALIQQPEALVREDGVSSIYYGFGLAVVERDGAFYKTSHTGDDDWLGHNSVVTAFADGDIIIVLSNSGYINGRGWSAEVARDVQKLLGK